MDVAVIGAGFSSLSAACYLAKEGHRVTVYEKNENVGGRARQFCREGFRFDMGPTFYWMPDLFDSFFRDFGSIPADFYDLVRLDPGYRIYFGEGDFFDQSADLNRLKKSFETIEPGSATKLGRYLDSAGYNYRVAVDKVIYKPGKSPLELLTPETVSRSCQFIESLSGRIARSFKDPRLRQMLEFPVLFLGAKPERTPSFYRFMNYADMVLGSWHVAGGMVRVAEGMRRLARNMGVDFRLKSPVECIKTEGCHVTSLRVHDKDVRVDAVVSGADYHHTESLLPEKARNHTEGFWEKRVFAPSAILFYIAFDKTVENVSHHTLFFDTSFKEHAHKIYDRPGWPENPMFYASFPSKTDARFAPRGKESAVILIPTAAGLTEDESKKEEYLAHVIRRMETLTGQELASHILFYESYGCSDFITDYHSCKGNAYGLANTLTQTGFMRPAVRNKKLKNLFYTGQLTVPGPGVPTALVSGKVSASAANKYLKKAAKK